jgi:putative ABC transport system permease protein
VTVSDSRAEEPAAALSAHPPRRPALRFFLRALWRETRGARGRALFLCACIALGVSAVVSVGAFIEAIEQSIRAQSRELLGGDLALEARRALPDAAPYLPLTHAGKLPPQVGLYILSTMVHGVRGTSRLAEVKAIDTRLGSYPLVGKLLLEPARPLDELLDDHSVLIAPELRDELALKPGDTLTVGGQELRVAGVVRREPDPLGFTFSFGPRVLMTQRALERTGLLGFGNRVRYRRVFAFPDQPAGALGQIKQELRARMPGATTFISVETHDEAQPALRAPLAQAQRYFGLVALLSLLVAGVGVAQIVATWLAHAAPRTAILRCLGLRPREVAALYLAQVLLLALIGSLIGAVLGASLPRLVLLQRPDLLPLAITPGLPLWPMLRGIGLGVFVALLLCLPSLSSVWRVSPLQVLRSEAEPLPAPRSVRFGSSFLAISAVFAAAWLVSEKALIALGFAAGVGGLALLLWLGALGLAAAVRRLPRARLPPLIWQGMAALGRPGAGTRGSIVALGLGTLVVVGVALLQGILNHELAQALPRDAPSVFLVDVQPDQWPEIQRLCREAGAERLTSTPVITARLAAVDGRSIEQLVQQQPGNPNERDRSRWMLTREQRLTFMRNLPPDNRIVDGKLWQDPDPNELSMEQGFAQSLGVKVGSRVRFDIQGVTMDFKVTSLRTLDFRSFAMNFFLVAEPGALDEAPQIVLGGVRLPAAAEQGLQDRLAQAFPNVTVLRVQGLLKRAAGILDQLALAVRLLGSFAVLTGLVILAGAVASSELTRAREAALLKTLGITRLQVVSMFALEYALKGALAGSLGALGGYLLTAFLASQLLDLHTPPSWLTCLLALLSAVVLSVVAGLLASVRSLLVRPLEVLRAER